MNVLVALTFILAVSFVYGDECYRGQVYWCSDIAKAKSCGAVKHCMDNVWSQKKPYEQDTTDVCSFCENVITDIRNAFSPKNEAKMKKYLDKACNICPAADECKKTINDNLDEVFKLIRSKLDPKAVCSALRLCTGYQGSTPMVPKPKLTHVSLSKSSSLTIVKALVDNEVKPVDNAPAPDVCKDCEKLVTDLKAMITSKDTEAQIENYIKENLCATLGPAKDECDGIVSQYIPEVMQMLEQQVDASMICQTLGFCKGGDKSILPRMRLANSPLFKAASQLRGSSECDACKVILGELQDLDRNQVVQTDLENLLKNKLCPALGSLKDECITTVEQYGQFLFEFLANELDPATRCQSLGFCSSDNMVTATRKATPLTNGTQHKPGKVGKGNVKQSVECVLCEFVMTKLEDILEQNKSEAAIVQALDKVCNILPDTIKESCRDFIDKYGPAILDLLAQELAPQLVCTSLGLCKTGSGQTPSKLIFPMNTVMKTTENCGICETIVQYVDSLVSEKSTEKEIEKTVEKVCNFLPPNLKDECNTFVKLYGPQIIQLILQYADPQKVCQELGLCAAAPKAKSSPMEVILPAKAMMVGVNECTYGPSYWCANLDNAKKCKAVAHCEKHGWVKNNF